MNITYLLGAGASAQVIPVVANFNKTLMSLLENLKHNRDSATKYQSGLIEDLLKDYEITIKDFGILLNDINKHASIDTYAKKLYLTNQHDKLRMLKAIIDMFFIEHQLISKVPKKDYMIDLRYDAFIASIAEKVGEKLVLPPNINILTWNYDLQLELSLRNFLQINDFNDLEKRISFIPNSTNKCIEKGAFSIVKLNGTASGYENDGSVSKDIKFRRRNLDVFLSGYSNDEQVSNEKYNALVRGYDRSEIRKLHSTIHYSWENTEMTEQIRNSAFNIASKTNILVTIGYSFPTFNRDIDRKLLNNSSIEKIFVQTNSKESALVNIEKAKSLIDSSITQHIEFIPISNANEFYIPYEFNFVDKWDGELKTV
jgi:hypothetical protein